MRKDVIGYYLFSCTLILISSFLYFREKRFFLLSCRGGTSVLPKTLVDKSASQLEPWGHMTSIRNLTHGQQSMTSSCLLRILVDWGTVIIIVMYFYYHLCNVIVVLNNTNYCFAFSKVIHDGFLENRCALTSCGPKIQANQKTFLHIYEAATKEMMAGALLSRKLGH